MFERYTERARRILFFARYEASQLGSISIEPDHLLLGLIRESQGLVFRIFEHAKVSVEEIRSDIVARREVSRTKLAASVEIPFTPATKRILQFAADEADTRHDSFIGAEHLLLGILREEPCAAASTLRAKGLTLDDVRAEIARSTRTADHGRPPESYRDLPTYVPSEVVHISLSRRAPGDVTHLDDAQHWVVAGADLPTVIARAWGGDPGRVDLQDAAVPWEIGTRPPHRSTRYDVVLVLPYDAPADAKSRLVRQAIQDQFGLVVTAESSPEGDRIVARANRRAE